MQEWQIEVTILQIIKFGPCKGEISYDILGTEK